MQLRLIYWWMKKKGIKNYWAHNKSTATTTTNTEEHKVPTSETQQDTGDHTAQETKQQTFDDSGGLL